jgi:hypothetical protein
MSDLQVVSPVLFSRMSCLELSRLDVSNLDFCLVVFIISSSFRSRFVLVSFSSRLVSSCLILSCYLCLCLCLPQSVFAYVLVYLFSDDFFDNISTCICRDSSQK